VIILLTFTTFIWTFYIFHWPLAWDLIAFVTIARIAASYLIFQDYSLSWSKSTPRTFLIKTLVYFAAFVVYAPLFYREVPLSLLVSELLLYLFVLSFSVYFYYFWTNKSSVEKDKSVVIFGAGSAGIKLKEEFHDSEYKIKYFVDDDAKMQKRSIDGIKIISKYALKEKLEKEGTCDLLLIAMPSADKKRIQEL
jgi:FlaA1/EpsC-like NDP-sugar epimerase